MSEAASVPLLDTLYATMDALANRAALTLESAAVDLLDAPPSAARDNALTLLCAPHAALRAALNVYLTMEAAREDPRHSPTLIYRKLAKDDLAGQAM